MAYGHTMYGMGTRPFSISREKKTSQTIGKKNKKYAERKKPIFALPPNEQIKSITKLKIKLLRFTSRRLY